MKYYLVGGAVRDRLLGQPVRERDWLVVGGTPAALRARGFRQVGKSFPVFLHPETGEEYSLPRGGAGPGDTEEAIVARDLAGRDLTVNAMALSPAGRLLDPLGGERDLRERLLRHTPAFEEDPLRVLRLARLLARYAPLGFRVADETARLVTRLAAARAYRSLPPDRVWAEIEQALTGERPRLFFEFLQERRALSPWLPELSALFGVPQPEIHHPEIDTGVHTLMVLDQACRLTGDPATRFAALCHDLGKGSTPREIWPRHAGHEKRSVHAVNALCLRLPVPNRFKSLALLVAAYHTHCHRAPRLNPGTLLDTLAAADAFRRPERFEHFLTACEADARGRLGFEQSPYPQAALMRDALGAAAGVDAAAIARATGDGERVAAAIWRARRQAIERMLERRADAGSPPP
jgi:tRNA nucleotidyltransferase (CCA-adding enzyme)